jgi:hypothetical protein
MLRKNKRWWAISSVTAIFVLWGLFASACQSTDDDLSIKPSLTKPKPSGKIYFSLTNVDSVYYLDADRQEFGRFPLTIDHLWDFDVSKDGNWLLVLHGQQIDRINLLKFRIDYSVHLKLPPIGKLTCEKKGSVALYETTQNAQKRIAIVYVESGDNFLLKSKGDLSAYAPLIQPSGGAFAWTQNDGLYYSKIGQQSIFKLSDAPLISLDFSPSGNYLSSGGEIFDLYALSKYPGEHGGKLKFIDDYNLIQQKPIHSDSLQRINISGTARVSLFQTHLPIVDFVISDGQRFVLAVSQDDDRLLFDAYDFVDREKEFHLIFPTRQGQLKKLLWPMRPASLTGND